MRIGDKTPPPGTMTTVDAELQTPNGRRIPVEATTTGEDLVTIGEDLYGILCELVDQAPVATNVGIAAALQTKPHPAFGELSVDVREAFEAAAAAFEDDDDDEGTDGDEDDED